MSNCDRCNDEGTIECPHCGGTGYEPASTDMSLGGWVEAGVDAAKSIVQGPEECHKCKGEGRIPCPECSS